MSKAVDLLLNDKFNARIEIKRLSEQFGQPFLLELKSVDMIKISSIADEDERFYKILHDGIDEDFDNPKLLAQNHVDSFRELINKLFVADETKMIYDKIVEISTLTEEEDKELKDSVYYDNAYWLWKNHYIDKPSDYFKYSYIDKKVINDFIIKIDAENAEKAKRVQKLIKDSKDSENANLNILFQLFLDNLQK